MQHGLRLMVALVALGITLLAPAAHADIYAINVRTGWPDGAGTDANVYVQLFGKNAWGSPVKTDAILLDVPGRNDFERGSWCDFHLSAPPIHTLDGISIGHDNTGHRPGWYLEWVEIRNETRGWVKTFEWYGWLARDENDANYGTSTSLTPGWNEHP